MGVTLVPVRVITEAFGANVEWVAETKHINISYPDVEIVLQINNPIAEVNGKAESLLSAPELTPNGFTMVPLRFISETFGATVGYDDATQRVTVVKETPVSDQGIVECGIEEAKVGDSYYNRSMDTPVNLQMNERSFDGTYTEFSNEKITLYIKISATPEDYDFDKDFNNEKSGLSGFILVKADKTSDDNSKSMHFQCRDTEIFFDVYKYITADYTFMVFGAFDNTDSAARDEGTKLAETFKCVYEAENTHDLSNVENNSRKYTSESMAFSINIPEDYYFTGDESLDNQFRFEKLSFDDNVSEIAFEVYSKNEAGTAKELAQTDFELVSKATNEAISTFSDAVYEAKYNNFSAYEYTYDIYLSNEKSYNRDTFFEFGEYVYNIHITLQAGETSTAYIADEIINSIVLGEIDSSKVGLLMRNRPSNEELLTYEKDKWYIKAPASFSELDSSDSSISLSSFYATSGINLHIENVVAVNEANAVNQWMDDMKNTIILQGYDLVSSQNITIGEYNFYELIYKYDTDSILGTMYVRQMAALKKGNLVYFTVMYPERYYSEYSIKQTEEVIASLTFK